DGGHEQSIILRAGEQDHWYARLLLSEQVGQLLSRQRLGLQFADHEVSLPLTSNRKAGVGAGSEFDSGVQGWRREQALQRGEEERLLIDQQDARLAGSFASQRTRARGPVRHDDHSRNVRFESLNL